MSQKIGMILMVVLVIWAVVLLSPTGEQVPADRTPETTAPDLVQTTAPRTEGELTAPPVTVPTAPSEPEPDAARRVAKALEGRAFAETAASHRVYTPGLNAAAETLGTAASTCGYALAELAGERKMNPIAAFWVLVSEGLYEKTVPSGSFPAAGFQVPEQAAKEYTYTAGGVRQFLDDLLTLSSRMEDGLGLETALMGDDLRVNEEQIYLSEADNCRYAYFACGGERSTHILCFYLRSGDGERITDLEFQLLNLNSAQGNNQALAALDRRGDNQAAVLMTAAELLLTGRTRTGEGKVSESFELGGYKATLERFAFTGSDEWGGMINYRIRAK